MIENFATNCTAPQDGEEREKIFKTLRDWSESEYQEEIEYLGIDDSNMSLERKKILVILYMLSGVKDKEGWFYIDNANLSEICNVGERTITRVKRDFERLGIIKIKRGYQGSPTRYKFFEKKLNKLPKISKKTHESTLALVAGKNVIPATENEIYKSVIDSLLSSCAQVPAKVDSKKIEKKNIVEGGVQYKEKEQYKDKEEYQYKKQYEYQEQELEQNEYKEQDKYKKQMKELGLILSDNNAKLIESINTIVQAIVNTKDETIEELKKIYTSIDNITRVQSEHNTKLDKLFELIEEKDKVIEGKDKLINELQAKLQSSSMDNNGKSNGEIQPSIDTKDKVDNTTIESSTVQSESNSKVIEESDNSKDVNESNGKSNGEIKDSSSSNVDDRIMSYQLGLASSNPIKDIAWKREQQKKVDTKTASKRNVGIVQESNSSEINYTLNKLRKEIVEPFKWMISNINDYGKLDKAENDFYNAVNKLYSNHSNVITKSEIEPFIDEVRTVIQHKEEELTPKDDTKDSSIKSNVGIVQDSPKEVDKRFHTEEKTAPKAETCEEKKETTAEPSTADCKTTEVPKADTLHSKEEQEKLDEEVDEAASSIFLEGNSNNTTTKKCEEVEFPKVEQIALREEEQKQLQELKENKAIKPLLENFTNVRFTDQGSFENILMKIRKAVTDGNYNKKVVQAFLDFSYTTYTFDCNVEDAMKPIEDVKEEIAETQSDEENRSVDDVMKSFPKTDKRFNVDEDQGEVIEDSDDEVTDDDMKGVVVGGSYPEENDAIF